MNLFIGSPHGFTIFFDEIDCYLHWDYITIDKQTQKKGVIFKVRESFWCAHHKFLASDNWKVVI